MEKRKDLLNKKKAALILASSLVVGTPSLVQAETSKLNKLFNWAESVEEKVYEYTDPITEKTSDKVQSIEIYKQSSLRVITDIPGIDPSEERSYYLICDTVPGLEKIYYLDEDGNKISRNSGDKRYKVHQTNKKAVFNGEGPYVEKITTDLLNDIEFTNTLEFTADYYYETNLPMDIEYGYFATLSDIVPEADLKEKYTHAELKELEANLNNLDYELAFTKENTLKRR